MAYSNMGFNNAGGIKYLHNNYADSLLSVGTDFGKTWGTYRYNVYLISGLIFTVVGAIVLYVVLTFVYKDTFSSQTLGSYIGAYVSTYYINMSIFLAFAATYPGRTTYVVLHYTY